MDTELYKQPIDETLETLINQFHRKPHNFFNEHEFHAYCYHVFYGKKEFSEQFTTLDGKKTNILKPEYPSIARISRKRIEIDPKGDRAHYDMAILDPEFVKSKFYNVVTNKEIGSASKDTVNLIAAIEFKYITKHSKNFIHEIKYDLFKLANANEAVYKYMLVFESATGHERDYFKEGLIHNSG